MQCGILVETGVWTMESPHLPLSECLGATFGVEVRGFGRCEVRHREVAQPISIEPGVVFDDANGGEPSYAGTLSDSMWNCGGVSSNPDIAMNSTKARTTISHPHIPYHGCACNHHTSHPPLPSRLF